MNGSRLNEPRPCLARKTPSSRGNRTAVVLLSILLPAASFAAEPVAAAASPLACPRPVELLQMDGRVDEPAWSSAARVALPVPEAGKAGGAIADFRFLADDRSIYVGWRIRGAAQHALIARSFFPQTDDGEPAYSGVYLECRIAGDPPDGPVAAGWFVGAEGQLRSLGPSDSAAGKGSIHASAVVEGDRWQGEAAIPLSILEEDKSGGRLEIRVGHLLRQTGLPAVRATSSWRSIVLPAARPTRIADTNDLLDAEDIDPATAVLPAAAGAPRWSGPPVRILCIGPPEGISEIAALVRRYNIAAAFVLWDASIPEPDRRESLDELMRRLRFRWDAALVGNVPWASLPAEIRRELLGRTIDGLGLVLSRAGSGSDGTRRLPFGFLEPNADSPGTLSEPWTALAEELAPLFAGKAPPAAVRIGSGRLLRLLDAPASDAPATALPDIPWSEPDAALLREDWFSAIARSLLWAAGRPDHHLDVRPGTIRWTAGASMSDRTLAVHPAPDDQAQTVETVIYDPDLEVVEVRRTDVDPRRITWAGSALFLPALNPGEYRLLVRLRSEEEIVRWAQVPLIVAPAIEGFRARATWASEIWEAPSVPGPVRLRFDGLPADPPPEARIAYAIRDDLDRLLAEGEIPLEKTGSAFREETVIALPPETPRCRLAARYEAGRDVLAEARDIFEGRTPDLPLPRLWVAVPETDWARRRAVEILWPLDPRTMAWVESVDGGGSEGLRVRRDVTGGAAAVLAPVRDPAAVYRSLRTLGLPPGPCTGWLIRSESYTEKLGAEMEQRGCLPTLLAPAGAYPPPETGTAGLFPAEICASHPVVRTLLRRNLSGTGLEFDPRSPAGPALARWAPWECAALGGDTLGIGLRRAAPVVTADLRLSPWVVSVTSELSLLHRGLGTLLAAAGPPVDDGIAILWSTDSLQTTVPGLIPHVETEPAHLIEATAVHACLSSLGYMPTFVEEERFAAGADPVRPIRILWLPWTTRLRPETVDRLRSFVKSGGTVVADGLPGVRDSEGRMLNPPPLAGDFGVAFSAEGMTPTAVVVRGNPDDPTSSFDAVADAGVRLVKANPLQVVDGLPVGSVQPDGSGRWVYLNLWMEDAAGIVSGRATGYRVLVRNLLDRWKVPRPDVRIVDSDGRVAADTRLLRMPWGRGCTILLASRLPGGGRISESDLVLRLDGLRTLYDLRTGTRISTTDRVHLGPIAPGETRIFAAWDGSPPALTFAADTSPANAAGAPFLQVKASRGPVACHIEIFDADGRRRPEYSRAIVDAGAQAGYRFHPALDDPPGEWRAVVRDLVSDRIDEYPFRVLPPANP